MVRCHYLLLEYPLDSYRHFKDFLISVEKWMFIRFNWFVSWKSRKIAPIEQKWTKIVKYESASKSYSETKSFTTSLLEIFNIHGELWRIIKVLLIFKKPILPNARHGKFVIILSILGLLTLISIAILIATRGMHEQIVWVLEIPSNVLAYCDSLMQMYH